MYYLLLLSNNRISITDGSIQQGQQDTLLSYAIDESNEELLRATLNNKKTNGNQTNARGTISIYISIMFTKRV